MSAQGVSMTLVNAMAGLIGTAPISLGMVTSVRFLRPIVVRLAVESQD